MPKTTYVPFKFSVYDIDLHFATNRKYHDYKAKDILTFYKVRDTIKNSPGYSVKHGLLKTYVLCYSFLWKGVQQIDTCILWHHIGSFALMFHYLYIQLA